MITENDMRELGEISQKLFIFGEECLVVMRRSDTRQRDFEALSIDIASRFSYMAQLLEQIADDIGTAGYSMRDAKSDRIVSAATRKYLSLP